jgi:hypothetical protein
MTIIIVSSLLILLSCGIFDPLYEAMGNPLFIAAGDRIMTSVDGKTWNDSTTIPIHPVNEVIYANGCFVAVDDSGDVLISEKGTSWERRTVYKNNILTSIIYAQKKFVVTGECEGIWKSDDAVTWDTINRNGSGNWINDIAYGNGRFVCVGWQIAGWSDDGNTFHLYSITTDLNSIAFGKGTFIAAGFSSIIKISHDGESWKNVNLYIDNIELRVITYDIGIFMAGGININDGKPLLFHSSDGIHWKDVSPSSEIGDLITDIQFGNNSFIAVGELYKVWRSKDDFLWEEIGRSDGVFNCIGYRP